MKAYLITTGLLFALLVLAHIWRLVEEGAGRATDPVFATFTIVAAALAIWAWRLLRGPTARSR
jgi:hypothetical protein